MKVLVRLLALLVIFAIDLPACHSDDGSSTGKKNNPKDKGVNHAMKTYYMGRFALDVPVEMTQAVQAQTIRYAEIKEFQWPEGLPREKARTEYWNSRLSEIKQLKKPDNIKDVILQERSFTNLGQWSKGVMYYGDYIITQRHFWSVIADYGKFGICLKLYGTNDKLLLDNLTNILSHYQQPVNQSNEPFYLINGAINLPYLEQEKTYSRFEGHALNLKLEVEMNETHKVEKLGVAERLAASIAINFAPGVDVEKIRSRSRTAAGLKGEELVMRMSASGEDTQIQFGWEYRGEVDSGERPEIQITMETPDGNLKEKLKVWDAILDSFKPMYR